MYGTTGGINITGNTINEKIVAVQGSPLCVHPHSYLRTDRKTEKAVSIGVVQE
jgi:hypothetical protein